jgi:hypothetical protein
MTVVNAEKKLKKLVALLEIPKGYYEKAAERHRSLGEWFCRPESKIAVFNPVVYPQGSFRLGTVIRPLLRSDEYDLDIVGELVFLTKLKITQRELKRLVGEEVKAYARAHNIVEPVRERTRCWRLNYSDELNFHIDVLACIPEDATTIAMLTAWGVDPTLAEMAIALTCNKSPYYEVISNEWPTSNPSGYGQWFEDKMAVQMLSGRKSLVAMGEYRSIEDVPAYTLKTPLQRSIQLLKRHRDVMFKDDCEMKPISMIITTLAAMAYQGEEQLDDALFGILDRMTDQVQSAKPRIANPVNPGEDFADKWDKNPELEKNFWLWHRQAVQDFGSLVNAGSAIRLQKNAQASLSLNMSDEDASSLTPAVSSFQIAAPAIVVARSAPSPWKDHG